MIEPDQVRLELIQTYASALENLWNYYFTVVIGTVAVIAGLLGESGRLDKTSAWFLAVILAIFGIGNLVAIWQVSGMINSNIDSTTAHYKEVLTEQNFRPWSVFFQPVGWLAAIFFVWKKTAE